MKRKLKHEDLKNKLGQVVIPQALRVACKNKINLFDALQPFKNLLLDSENEEQIEIHSIRLGNRGA